MAGRSQPPSPYSAHLALSAIGEAGQERIGNARVALIGLGGLGNIAAQYLAASGVGQLTVCDFDRIETSNLARQVLYTPADVGRPKVEAARERLLRLNPAIVLNARPDRIDRASALELARSHDLCIDASDNYGTRLALNSAAIVAGTPWVMGSCIRFEGQLMLFRPERGGPCYRCVYGGAPDTLEDCPGAGVFAPVAGIIGTSMAHIALSFLAGMAVPGEITVFDAAVWQWRRLKVARKTDCSACGDSQAP